MRRFKTGWKVLLVAIGLLLPVGAAVWMTQIRRAEVTPLIRAEALLREGRLEESRAALAVLERSPHLSFTARKRTAILLCRLGEDRSAHAILSSVPASQEDPLDVELRDLGARSQEAATLLARVDLSRVPSERARLAEQALERVPQSPYLMARVARERLLEATALRGNAADAAMNRFLESYADLRRFAPRLADQILDEMKRLEGAPGRAAPKL